MTGIGRVHAAALTGIVNQAAGVGADISNVSLYRPTRHFRSPTITVHVADPTERKRLAGVLGLTARTTKVLLGLDYEHVRGWYASVEVEVYGPIDPPAVEVVA